MTSSRGNKAPRQNQDQWIRQLSDRAVATEGPLRLHAQILALAREHAPHPTLAAVPPEVVPIVQSAGSLPRNAEVVAHKEVIQGSERTDVRGLLILAPWRDPAMVLERAQALTGNASPAQAVIDAIGRDIREGTVKRVISRVYGDEPRTEENPLDILVLSEDGLDLPNSRPGR